MRVIRLSAYGYEAEILPERGANLLSLTRPELDMVSVRTPDSLDAFATQNPFFFGMPFLLPPNRISGA